MAVPFMVLSFIALFFPEHLISIDVPCISLFDQSFGGKFELFKIRISDITVSIVMIGLIISLLFVAFSKEKIEDEYVSRIRERSLVWAVVINYIIIIVGILFMYDMTFFYLLLLNLVTMLLLFIFKFNYEINQSRKALSDEK